MTGGRRVDVIPKETFVRINRLALGTVVDVDKSVVLEIRGEPVKESINIEPVKRDRDRLTRKSAEGGVELSIELLPIFGRRSIQGGRLRDVVSVIRDKPEGGTLGTRI